MGLIRHVWPWYEQPQEVGVYAGSLSDRLVAYIPALFEASGRYLVTPDAGMFLAPTRRGLLLDGFNASRVATTNLPRITGPFTVALDFYYGGSSAGGQTMVAQGGSSGSGGGWAVSLTTGNTSPFRLTFGGVADYSASSGAINVGDFVRLSVVVSGNGGTARYFINGSFDSSRAVGTQIAATRSLAIGASWNGSSNTLPVVANNNIGNVSYWARALTDAEIYEEAQAPWAVLARTIDIPYSVASGIPVLSAPTFVPGSLTSTGWRGRVTAS